jgi:hypothetical protein
VRRPLLLAVLIGLALLGAADARAEIYTATLTEAKPAYNWDGYAVGFGGECAEEAELRCDSIVFILQVGGDLNISVDVEGDQIGAYPDINLSFYAADDTGAPVGDPIAEANTPLDDEKIAAPALVAGRYVLQVRSQVSIGESYLGKSKLTNLIKPKSTAPPPLPAPPQQTEAPPAPPTPPAQPKPASSKPSKKKAVAACKKKARKIRNAKKRARAVKRCSKKKR